jgi:phage/plasmid-like protein (TIGR03299 family)
MSHELTIREDGTAEMWSGKGVKPWHALGQLTPDAKTWAEAMILAQMGWTVSKHQLSLDGTLVPAWGIVRDDNKKFLGMVGDQFTPIQNVAMGNHIDALIGSTGAHYETAGTLRGGQKVWTMAKLPWDIKVGEDITESYILVTQGHDGSLSYTLKYTGVRVVCNNTLTMALGGKGSEALKTKHTKFAEVRIQNVCEAVAGIQTSIQDLQANFKTLAIRKVDREVSRKLMDKIFGEDWKTDKKKLEKVEQIAQLFDANDGNAYKEQKGTAYAMYNACTNWSDHLRPVRMTEQKGAYTVTQARVESALWGTGEAWKTQVLDEIMEMTASCPVLEPAVSVGGSAKIAGILSQMKI